jgi:ubiquinone/menaquinone biosynthesis C-methylase UbiE
MRMHPVSALSMLALLFAGSVPAGEAPHHEAHRAFDNPAEYTRSWDDPARDAWQKPAGLVAALGVKAGMAVADIGTGTGYLVPHLSRAAGPGGRVYAVDVSPQMLKWVQDRATRENLNNVSTVEASGNASGLPAASVDRAIMINVWHHIEDPVAYARSLHASLKAGGTLFIVEAKPDAGEGPPRHFRLDPKKVIAVLEQAGFKATVDPFQIDRQYVVRGER